MNDSKFHQAIQTRLDDPLWDQKIARYVLSNQATSSANREVSGHRTSYSNGNRQPVLRLAVAILLVAGAGFLGFLGFPSSSEYDRDLGQLSLTNNSLEFTPYDITTAGDLLWEEDDLTNDYLLLGWGD